MAVAVVVDIAAGTVYSGMAPPRRESYGNLIREREREKEMFGRGWPATGEGCATAVKLRPAVTLRPTKSRLNAIFQLQNQIFARSPIIPISRSIINHPTSACGFSCEAYSFARALDATRIAYRAAMPWMMIVPL